VNGEAVAVSSSDDGSIRLWHLAVGASRLLGAHQSTVGAITIGSARNKVLAITGSEDGIVRTWDLTKPEPTGDILGDTIHSAVKTVVTGSIKGAAAAISGSDENVIRIWDLATRHPDGNGLTGPAEGSEPLAIGAVDGRALVVSGHWDGTIWAWTL
jgi:WD40 repeat protein